MWGRKRRFSNPRITHLRAIKMKMKEENGEKAALILQFFNANFFFLNSESLLPTFFLFFSFLVNPFLISEPDM